MPPSFSVTGGRALKGTIRPAGNKNAALPILAATLLADGPCRIDNVPHIRDVETMLALLVHLGADVRWLGPNRVEVNTARAEPRELDPALCARIRASILLAGPMLARLGRVSLPPPGGDVIGRRRVDTHFLALERLGARKWVSTRRRPITSPPGGGRLTRPKRASIGPASRIDARIRAHNLGSSSRGSARAVFTSTAFGAVHATAAPRCASSSSIVSTSRMWGTLSMRQGPSASSVAARMGSAAFLLPAGRMVPLSGRPPVTAKDGGMGEASYAAACAGVKRSRTLAT